MEKSFRKNITINYGSKKLSFWTLTHSLFVKKTINLKLLCHTWAALKYQTECNKTFNHKLLPTTISKNYSLRLKERARDEQTVLWLVKSHNFP